MKKKLYILTVILLPVLGYSQFKIGVQGGFSIAKTQTNSTINFTSKDHRLGPLLGVMLGMDIGDSRFSLMQEMNYVAKGVRFVGTINTATTPISLKGKHSTHWVELPMNLLYYLDLGNGHIFVGGGPYVAFGVTGKDKITYQVDPSPEVEETVIKFGSDTYQIKRFDYGVHGLIGYKLGYGSYLKVFYSHGLANLSNIDHTKYTNSYFGISFGYFFNSGR